MTGATGFIGSHLVENLLERGVHVRCLIRKTSDLKWLRKLPIELVHGDCGDKASLREAVRGVDQVFHVAGVTKAINERTYFEVNALGTENLIHACLEHNTRLQKLVYISSQAAAGPCRNGGKKRESDLCEPVSPYGRSKRMGEEVAIAHSHELPLLILEEIIGSIGAWRKKQLDFKLGLIFGIPKGIGAIIGALLTSKLSEPVLGFIFGFLALILSYNMIRFTVKDNGRKKSGKSEIIWQTLALLPFIGAVVIAIIMDNYSENAVLLSIGVLTVILSYNMFRFSMIQRNNQRKINGEEASANFLNRLVRMKPTFKVTTKKYSYTISIPVLIVGGVAIGIISGMLGVGGGWIQTPLLVLAFGVPLGIASGTSMFMILISSITGVRYGTPLVWPGRFFSNRCRTCGSPVLSPKKSNLSHLSPSAL